MNQLSRRARLLAAALGLAVVGGAVIAATDREGAVGFEQFTVAGVPEPVAEGAAALPVPVFDGRVIVTACPSSVTV